MDHAHRGEAALNAGQNAEAITHYTKALEQSPTGASYYIKRSTAYQRTSEHQKAFEDAEVAVTLAVARAKRELIARAQLRRAIALFNLERYGDANFVFELAKRYDPNEKSIGIWEAKLRGKLKALEEEDEKREVTIKEVPDVKVPEPIKKENATKKEEDTSINSEKQTNEATTAAASMTPAQTPASKIRHEWYQGDDRVTVTLFAKGVPKDQATVDVQPNSLSISFPLVTGSTFDISFDPLFSQIDPSSSTSRILSTKIEVVLKKSTPGIKWQDLEGQPTKAANVATSSTEPTAVPASTPGPAYPTSSRSGPKDWDKIAQSYSQKNKKPPQAEDEPKKEGEDGGGEENEDYIDDFEDGDPVNGFFKKLYAGASDETKKAMMKSYQESNGTALSTNWEEVSKGEVETMPPDGMEARKWGH